MLCHHCALCIDAPEFRQFLAKDAQMLSTAIKRIGRIEDKK
jgi:hypothetical protein